MSVKLWPTWAMSWSKLVFGDKVHKLTYHVRALRIVEEVIELAQAEGATIEEIDAITLQVFSKQAHPNPQSELGGVLTCVAAYAGFRSYDLEETFQSEMLRMMTPEVMERVRQRNLAGDKIGIPK